MPAMIGALALEAPVSTLLLRYAAAAAAVAVGKATADDTAFLEAELENVRQMAVAGKGAAAAARD
jgi:hypothetical protein